MEEPAARVRVVGVHGTCQKACAVDESFEELFGIYAAAAFVDRAALTLRFGQTLQKCVQSRLRETLHMSGQWLLVASGCAVEKRGSHEKCQTGYATESGVKQVGADGVLCRAPKSRGHADGKVPLAVSRRLW